MKPPYVIWITGLSASGKTTVAESLVAKLKNHGQTVEHLDGDRMRKLFPNTGFSKNDRNNHIHRVGNLASEFEKKGVTVVASFISPYRDARTFVRSMCQQFVEVYLCTPLKECERRDPKGLYEKARKGEIENFTGISDPYEPPINPEIKIDTSNQSIEETIQIILNYLQLSDN